MHTHTHTRTHTQSRRHTHTHTHCSLTVRDRLHTETQQCVQEVHDVIERVAGDVLPHGQTELQLVQLVQTGQAVLRLEHQVSRM